MWLKLRTVCLCVMIVSLLSCIGLAAQRSDGLRQVKVTILNPNTETRDHNIPLFKQHDALPDYELIVNHSDGRTTNLGAKPNASAIDGLIWTVPEPLPVWEISSLRLQDRDAFVSDVITEVELVAASTEADGYRFDFKIESSLTVAISAFFKTPIGLAISAAFAFAVLLLLVSVLL